MLVKNLKKYNAVAGAYVIILIKDLLYALPDTKTRNKIRDKNWERIAQPHATGGTNSGGKRCKLLTKIVINTF